ncbi:hypothetical protein B0H66DRAFT_536170 [Apodospora peruviana]|uniref:Uncharacterized protein n=1 Tax=Apodospora peruviana TaxID=516989 RepID=A0AAE0M158_9PEZI|nr:hypothetical protein B0H66DRAFT_536170 [Apodospora peruviana]
MDRWPLAKLEAVRVGAYEHVTIGCSCPVQAARQFLLVESKPYLLAAPSPEARLDSQVRDEAATDGLIRLISLSAKPVCKTQTELEASHRYGRRKYTEMLFTFHVNGTLTGAIRTCPTIDPLGLDMIISTRPGRWKGKGRWGCDVVGYDMRDMRGIPDSVASAAGEIPDPYHSLRLVQVEFGPALHKNPPRVLAELLSCLDACFGDLPVTPPPCPAQTPEPHWCPATNPISPFPVEEKREGIEGGFALTNS